MNRTIRQCALILLLLPFSPFSDAISLGLAGRYNLFVLGDMTGYYSDVEGRLAVGGDLSLDHYAVGQQLDGTADFTDTLVVGGNLRFHDGRVYHGNIRYGGHADVQRVGIYDTDPGVPTGRLLAGPALDFTALRQDLYDRSHRWAGLGANGRAWRDNPTGSAWGLHLAGTDPYLNVFDLSADWLGGLMACGSTCRCNRPC